MAPLVLTVDLGPGVRAAVSGRDTASPTPAVGAAGNVSHRRPHRPEDLAAARRHVGTATDTDPARWHLMHQIHGAEVAIVDAAVPVGRELSHVDAAVTTEPDRPLVVQTADCVPLLFAGPAAVGVAHAGRVGFVAGVVGATVAALRDLGDAPGDLTVAIGPAIGGCCYEVPGTMRDEVAGQHPAAAAVTTWGTPALDLPGAIVAELGDLGVTDVVRAGGCTRCDVDGRWFSHRADPTTGRQLGLVVRATGSAA